MYFQNPLELVQYSQLSQQLKIKNKQIKFLQDKILLIQREKQTKLLQNQSKYTNKITSLIQTTHVLNQQNQQLRLKLQKYKHKSKGLSQRSKNLTNQINLLIQTQSNYDKQSKIYKSKYQKEKREINRLQQENINLRSLINVMERQITQLGNKNVKLIEEKNILMTTYNDYDQIKFKLDEIQGIYTEQYQNQIELIKKRMKNQLQQNTKDIIKAISCEDKCQRRQLQDDQLIQKNNHTVNINTTPHYNKLTKVKSQPQFQIHSQNQPLQQKQQEDQNINISQSKYEQQQKHYKRTLPVNNTYKSQRQYNQQQSWSNDLIKLKNFTQYGDRYILSLKQSPNLAITQRKIHFKHHQTYKIFNYISNILTINKNIKQELQISKKQLNQIKTQMQEKISSFLAEIENIQKQDQQFRRNIEINQSRNYSENQARINNQNTMLQEYQVAMEKNRNLCTQLQASKMLSRTFVEIVSKVCKKYQQMKQKMKQCLKYKNKSTMNSKTSKAKSRFRKALISILFIQTLKKSSQKLNRKISLFFGINKQNKLNQRICLISTYQLIMRGKSVIEREKSIDWYDRKQNRQQQNKFVPFNQNVYRKGEGIYYEGILERCVYELKKQKLLLGNRKSQKNQNLQLQNWFKNIGSLSQSQPSIDNSYRYKVNEDNIYFGAMKIILQQIFTTSSKISKY